MRAVAATIKTFLLLIAAYLLLGVVAYLVPDKWVQRHVGETLYIGDLLLSDYPKAILFTDLNMQDSYTMDAYTEAIIVNQALSMRSEGWRGILLMPRRQEGFPDQCQSLSKALGGQEGLQTVYYGRYWHGSTFVTRLLLACANFLQIRYLIYVLTTLLLLWCSIKLWTGGQRAAALAVPFSLLLVNVYVMQFSMQFAPVLVIALCGMLWVAYHPGMTRLHSGLFFMVLGSLTACFDLITVPAMSLGLPLLTWVVCRNDDHWRRGMGWVFAMALWWLGGYVATWLAKWGLATALTDMNVFADAYGEASHWSNDGHSYILRAIAECANRVHWGYLAPVAVALAALALKYPRRQGWPVAVQCALVLLIPFVYYLLMARPASHHSWFNYRALAVAMAALLVGLAALVDWQRIYPLLPKHPNHDSKREPHTSD